VTGYQKKQLRSSKLIDQIDAKNNRYRTQSAKSLETDRWRDRQTERQADRHPQTNYYASSWKLNLVK